MFWQTIACSERRTILEESGLIESGAFVLEKVEEIRFDGSAEDFSENRGDSSKKMRLALGRRRLMAGSFWSLT